MKFEDFVRSTLLSDSCAKENDTKPQIIQTNNNIFFIVFEIR